MAPPHPASQPHRRTDAFVTTHWSLILAAREPGRPGSEALDRLCRTYWPPLFAFARRDGLSPHDAEDAVQAFLARVLARQDFDTIHPERGRFRSFLLKSFRNFLVSRARGEQSCKRGGGTQTLPLDTEALEASIQSSRIDDVPPDKAFDREWARQVMERALQRLAQQHRSPSQARLFESLKHVLVEGETLRGAIELATTLGISPGALATAATRLRQRYRALIEDEVRQTLLDPDELEEELRTLWAAWN